jgi:hypothetical protein
VKVTFAKAFQWFVGLLALASAAVFVFRDACPFIPRVITGSLPNFAPVAFSPLIVLWRQPAARFSDFLRFAISACAAMVTYEVIQLWMPRRTFDWADMAASALGLPVALVFGYVFSRGPSAGGIVADDAGADTSTHR